MKIDLKHGDCLELMKDIPDGSVDAIICDLPYGTTECAWDVVLPFDKLWEQYKRIIKDNGAIVLFGQEPFSSHLRLSNIQHYKYDWIWLKNRPTNFAHSKNKPMKKHELISVFSKGTTVHESQSKERMPYNPQNLIAIDNTIKYIKKPSELTETFFSARKSHGEFTREFTNYPHSILEYSTDQLGIHPTQKPVALMEYLIKTYTNEGETVLDNCIGSGTTGVACLNTNRNFIGIEKEKTYFDIATNRIKDVHDKVEVADEFQEFFN